MFQIPNEEYSNTVFFFLWTVWNDFVSLYQQWGGHACVQWGLGFSAQSSGGATNVFELWSTQNVAHSLWAEGSGLHPPPSSPLLLSHLVIHGYLHMFSFVTYIKNNYICCNCVTFTELRPLFSVLQSLWSSLGAHWDPKQGSEELSGGVRRRCITHLKPEFFSVCFPDNCWDSWLYALPHK